MDETTSEPACNLILHASQSIRWKNKNMVQEFVESVL